MKKIFTKPVSMLLIIALLISSNISIKASNFVDFASYESLEFYGRSAPELIPLEMSTDSISFVAYSDGDTPDELLCYIQAYDDSGFELVVPILADGHVKAFAYQIPAKEYKVFFVGNKNIRKSNAFIIFTKRT